ncbi:MAG: hypothetical protein ACOYYU_05950 [Chloroflexota bacterium]
MKNNAVHWLRVSYWVGAIVDFAAGLMMVIPALFAFMNQPVDFHPTADYRYAMGMGAPLMFGWTALLLWADRQPLERKGILPITLLVVIGEVLTQAWGVTVGFVPLGALVPTFLLQAVIFALLLFSWLTARRVE